MTKKYEIILKKQYDDHSAIKSVGIEQYTLIRRGDDRAAIVRFFNNLGVRIDRLFFTLEQFDNNGNRIEVPENDFVINVCLDAGIPFEKEISTDKNCVAIQVCINKIRSGRDEYVFQNDKITVFKNVDSLKNLDIPQKLLISKKEKKGNRHGKLILIALVSVVALLIINILIALLHTL